MWEKFSRLLLRTELQGRKGSLLLLQALIKGMVGGLPLTWRLYPSKQAINLGIWGFAVNICLTGMSGATWL